jgi:hypothetical protein
VRDVLARDFHEAGAVTTFAASTPAAVRLDFMSVREWIESRVPGGSTERESRLPEPPAALFGKRSHHASPKRNWLFVEVSG